MVGGIRPSAGVVLPHLPPALLHYTINRRKLQAVRQKICAKKVKMLGGVPCAALVRPAAVVPAGGGGRAEPRRHLLFPPRGRGPSQTPPSLATDSSISPGPPSPWLPALPIERRFYRFCTELATPKTSPPAGACLARSVSAANGLMQGCRGRSPRRNKLIVSPFPTGEGGRGDRGQESKPKAGLAGEEKGKPPLRVPEWQGRQATARLRPPPGTCLAGSVSAANGLMQGCRGRSPRRNKLIVSPFPTGEGGRGDRGQESKPKAGLAGEEKGKPPAGHHSGRDSRFRQELCEIRPAIITDSEIPLAIITEMW